MQIQNNDLTQSQYINPTRKNKNSKAQLFIYLLN